jgi:hypothetical protein
MDRLVLKEITTLLPYKDQLINAVKGTIYTKNQMKPINKKAALLKYVVRIVTTGL